MVVTLTFSHVRNYSMYPSRIVDNFSHDDDNNSGYEWYYRQLFLNLQVTNSCIASVSMDDADAEDYDGIANINDDDNDDDDDGK